MQIRRTTVTLLATATLATFLGACDEQEAKPAEPAKAETKTEAKSDAKADEAKADEAKADEAKADEAKADEAKADEAKADEAEADEATPTAEAIPAAAGAPAEAGQAGPAYFVVHDKGTVMLDGGVFTKVDGGPDKLVKTITAGADGGVYLLGFEGIMKLDGAKATVVAETGIGGPTGSLEAFTVTKEGEFWAVGYKGISHWDGAAWKTEDKSVLGADVTLIYGVAVDGQGRVWVTSSNALHLREGDAWTTVDTSAIGRGKIYFKNVAVGPEGIAYAVAGDKLAKLIAPDSFEKIKIAKKYAMLDDLGFSLGGVGALETSIDQVARLMPDGSKTTYKTGKDFPADRIIHVASDDSGRVWVATDAGVAVLGPEAERVAWNSGSIDELAGQVEVIGVVGSGPELPGEVGPVKTGILKGRIMKGGAGFADTEVEICPKPSGFFRKSPCAESPTRRASTTDADGNFQMDDVPLGAYGLAVKVGGKWQLTYGSEYGADMKEGQAYDIGSVKLNED